MQATWCAYVCLHQKAHVLRVLDHGTSALHTASASLTQLLQNTTGQRVSADFSRAAAPSNTVSRAKEDWVQGHICDPCHPRGCFQGAGLRGAVLSRSLL